MDGVKIVTVDNLQGMEGIIVILEIPNTDGVGFLRDASRIRLAYSRARDGLIIITNINKLEAKLHVHSVLNRLFRFYKDNNAFTDHANNEAVQKS